MAALLDHNPPPTVSGTLSRGCKQRLHARSHACHPLQRHACKDATMQLSGCIEYFGEAFGEAYLMNDGHRCVWARQRMRYQGCGVKTLNTLGCGVKTLESHTQPQGAACGRAGSVQATGIEGSTRHCAYVGVRSDREVLDDFAAPCCGVSQGQSLKVSTVTWPPL